MRLDVIHKSFYNIFVSEHPDELLAGADHRDLVDPGLAH